MVINFFKKKKWMGLLIFALLFFGVIYFVLHYSDIKDSDIKEGLATPTTTTGSLWKPPTNNNQAMGNLLFNATSDCKTNGNSIACATSLGTNYKNPDIVGKIGIGAETSTIVRQINDFNNNKTTVSACKAIQSIIPAAKINGITDINAMTKYKPSTCK